MGTIDSNLIKPIVASEMLGFNYKILPNALKNRLIDYFGDGTEYVYKDKLMDFLSTHKSILDLRNEVIEYYSTVASPASFSSKYKQYLTAIKVDIIEIARRIDYFYISNEDFVRAVEYYRLLAGHPEQKLIIKADVGVILGLPNDHREIKKMLTEHLQPYFELENRVLYHLDEVYELKKLQELEIKNWQENYVSIEDCCIEFNVQNSTLIAWLKNHKIESSRPPFLIRVSNDDIDYRGRRKYILKTDAEKYKRHLMLQEKIPEIFEFYNVDLVPFETFERLLDVYEYSFNDSAPKTKEYWMMYAKEKIYKTGVRNLESFIHTFALQTGFLMDVINAYNKELFQLSTKEINFSLLNDQVTLTHKFNYYSFIKKIDSALTAEGLDSPFDLKNLRSPREERKVINANSIKKKEVYETQVYIDFFDYCANVEEHLEKTLNDASACLEESYLHLCSIWLYSIIHLTNPWEYSTILVFPRLEMEQYLEKDLNWLINNPIGLDEAKLIVSYFESQLYFRNKSQKDLYFMLNDDLAIAFANAALICEFVQREKRPSSKRLIEFKNNRNMRGPSKRTENAFFENFIHKEDFVFENRKMNRTIISLSTEVISKMTDRNPLEVTKYFRNHSSVETTNIYTILLPGHIESITDRLFNLGNFGYIYDAMSKLMLGEDPGDVDSALLIKSSFNEHTVIEGVARNLMQLQKDQEYVINVLKDTPKDELQSKLDQIEFGLMPSKKDGYQCLLGGARFCPNKQLECDKCNFNIPNKFALLNLSYDLEKIFKEIEDTFLNTEYEAEKVRLANKLYTKLTFLKSAINKFGREIVDQYIAGGLENINYRLSRLPETKKLVSSELVQNLQKEGFVMN